MRGLPLVAAILVAGVMPTRPAGAQDVDLTEIGHVVGDPNAPIAIVEFGDYACSACAEFHRDTWPPFLDELVTSGKVAFRFVPFRLGFPRGEDGAKAGECAANQGSFWEMHHLLYSRQADWAGERRPKERLIGYAEELGLELDTFRTCFEKHRTKDRTEAADAAADELRIRATPTFFIAGYRVQGALPIEAFRAVVEQISAGAR